MEKTVAAGEGPIRFLLVFIAVVALLNIGYHYTWNSTPEAQAAAAWPDISLKLGLSGLRQPTDITHAGDSSNRLFISEQRGRILIAKGNRINSRPFLDISDRVSCCGERGLLGMAFPPGFTAKKYFWRIRLLHGSIQDIVVEVFYVHGRESFLHEDLENQTALVC